ncbi:MAG: hypothetical protein QXT06_04120 [Candidatus Bathyarchaeia archaeon]
MSFDEAIRVLEEFKGGISQILKDRIKILVTPLAAYRGKSIMFLDACNLGFGILIELIAEIGRFIVWIHIRILG